ncbi:hypothetical protein QNI16_31300 [Cytophagaceae bacterium YF14B1]|uniref:Uncharacterized protein n=1 Tax=Xanthocytophaga flava TaxID=3048013 RepID=A0AAE3UA11_9BACT|nr:DUF5661 family protein [Xanthocytophaga flavus]MDJ1485026.1 hypothetical protein [Xanthocytophaga flavus]
MEQVDKQHFTEKEAYQIGLQIDIDWTKTNFEEFRQGLEIEMEHELYDPSTDVTGNDPILTGKIALAHLNEFPDYYSRLIKCFSH